MRRREGSSGASRELGMRSMGLPAALLQLPFVIADSQLSPAQMHDDVTSFAGSTPLVVSARS